MIAVSIVNDIGRVLQGAGTWCTTREAPLPAGWLEIRQIGEANCCSPEDVVLTGAEFSNWLGRLRRKSNGIIFELTFLQGTASRNVGITYLVYPNPHA